MKNVKIQIKRDETSKDTKNHLKFKKKLRRTLMQRAENRWNADRIDGKLSEFVDFDPLLDWDFRPICGCEVKGMEGIFYNVKHNKLFGKNGYLLYDDCISSCDAPYCACEGYELWLLDDLSLVFTYFCTVEDADSGAGMTYRYPLGRKMPADMQLNAETFLNELRGAVYALRKRM